VFLSRILDQDMPKNGLYFRKTCEIRRSVGGPPPNPRWPSADGAPPQTPCCYHMYCCNL